MKTFLVNTLGCKVNQYESQQIRELLERLGLRAIETDGEKPDLVVVNTCCVTHTASAKSRQYVRKAQKLSSDALVIVCGCLPTVQTSELSSLHNNIRVVKHQDDLASTLARAVNSQTESVHSKDPRHQCPQSHLYAIIRPENDEKIKRKNNLICAEQLTPLSRFKGQTRAFLKVQDGCDGICSYCIIPKTRPNVTNKPHEEAVREARALAEAGHREIVLTGVHLGAYGQKTARRRQWDTPENGKLADLLADIAAIPEMPRIRLSSLEPIDVTPRLLEIMSDHPNIMPHLHLSLQSGSDEVLRKMCRQYRHADFVRTVAQIKSVLDRPAITTDIIVGFPGETDADFEQTVSLAKEVGFAKMHIFKFSRRLGTAAASMQGLVNNKVTNERSMVMRKLDTELGRQFRRQFVGETAEVLVENTEGSPSGHCERYFVVHLQNTTAKYTKNSLVRAKLTEVTQEGAVGRAIETNPQKLESP